jgi:hypothetical protein
LILSGIATVPAMATMSVVHEQMHERTSKERKPYESAKDVRAMLGKEQRTADDEESKHHESCSRRQEASLRLTFMLYVVVHRHSPALVRKRLMHALIELFGTERRPVTGWRIKFITIPLYSLAAQCSIAGKCR